MDKKDRKKSKKDSTKRGEGRDEVHIEIRLSGHCSAPQLVSFHSERAGVVACLLDLLQTVIHLRLRLARKPKQRLLSLLRVTIETGMEKKLLLSLF